MARYGHEVSRLAKTFFRSVDSSSSVVVVVDVLFPHIWALGIGKLPGRTCSRSKIRCVCISPLLLLISFLVLCCGIVSLTFNAGDTWVLLERRDKSFESYVDDYVATATKSENMPTRRSGIFRNYSRSQHPFNSVCGITANFLRVQNRMEKVRGNSSSRPTTFGFGSERPSGLYSFMMFPARTTGAWRTARFKLRPE